MLPTEGRQRADVLLIPNSGGEDAAPVRGLHEFNKCHEPGGKPEGGQFCSDAEAGPPTVKPLQNFGRPVTIRPDSYSAVQRLALDASLSDAERAQKMFDELQAREPELVAQVQRMISHAQTLQAGWVEGLTALAKDMGLQLHSNIEDRAALADQNDYVFVGPVKSVKRTAVKSLDYYDPATGTVDPRNVKDLLRGSIAVNNANAMVTALQKLSKLGEVVSIKDNVSKPFATGYRDVNVVLRLRNGALAEMQVISKPMLRAKMGLGHRLYEAMRTLAPGSRRYNDLARRSSTLYNRAWMATLASATIATGLQAAVASYTRR